MLIVITDKARLRKGTGLRRVSWRYVLQLIEESEVLRGKRMGEGEEVGMGDCEGHYFIRTNPCTS